MATNPMDHPPPSSRPSTSETHLPENGPIPLFDIHLRFLTDSYLSFFHERKKIEEAYVESLLKLNKKFRTLDASLDGRTDLSTARSAWHEVRDNVEREAQTRQAFLSTLTIDVINPLSTVKETQERTRKRVKEDLKESSSSYHDYAEATLPKLKSRYLKKFSEVEDHKRSAMAPPMSPASPPPPEQSHAHNPPPNAKPYPAPNRPTVTSPQPLRALDRRPSGSAPTGRNRSPSSSTAFSDLAHQGKRQLNTLIGFLDKSNTVKDGGGRENSALRAVRAKRELDEADKEYRKGVHWLETLRLRRTKILESGYKSLSDFVEESSVAIKHALERYTDNMTATTTTQTQLSAHARAVVDKISPEKDVSKIAAYIPRSLASSIPDPVLYQHGLVGECKDLIFGFSLLDYATSHNLPDGEIPKIVKICIAEVDARGLEAEGIYRVSGRHAVVQTLQRDIELDESTFQFHPNQDVYCVGSLLKQYLRELPEPIFRYSLQDRINHSEDLAEHQSNNFTLLRAKMRRLPTVHQATMKALVEHLSRVVALSDKNKMDAKNLAIVFGGVIFGEDELPKGGDLLSVQNWKDSLMEDLIMNAHVLFNDDPAHNSPPLPPTPAGSDPAPKASYGSKSTKFALPAPLSAGALSSPTSPHPEDFTPRLPPRPANSIHPSLRTGQTSPTKERMEVPPLPRRLTNPYEDSPVLDTDSDLDSLEEAPSSSPSSPTHPGWSPS